MSRLRALGAKPQVPALRRRHRRRCASRRRGPGPGIPRPRESGAASRSRMERPEERVDVGLGIAHAGLEDASDVVEHHQPLGPFGRHGLESALDEEGTEDRRGSGSLTSGGTGPRGSLDRPFSGSASTMRQACHAGDRDGFIRGSDGSSGRCRRRGCLGGSAGYDSGGLGLGFGVPRPLGGRRWQRQRWSRAG